MTHVADAPAVAALAHQPLVTIVIPTYDDDPQHLREAVASALAQTYPRVEVVVVDDGSSRPETHSALDALTSVTLVRQDNAGPAAARNAGTAAGSGDVVICLDADDRLSPDFVAQAVTVLGQEPRARVAYPRMEPFGSDTSTAWPTRGELTVRDFAQRSAVPVCSVFHREDWAAAGGWDEEMRLGMEDHEWWVRLLGRTGGTAAPLPSAVHHPRVRQAPARGPGPMPTTSPSHGTTSSRTTHPRYSPSSSEEPGRRRTPQRPRPRVPGPTPGCFDDGAGLWADARCGRRDAPGATRAARRHPPRAVMRPIAAAHRRRVRAGTSPTRASRSSAARPTLAMRSTTT